MRLKELIVILGESEKALTVREIIEKYNQWDSGNSSRYVIYSFFRKYFLNFRKIKIPEKKRRYCYTLSKSGLRYYEKIAYDIDV